MHAFFASKGMLTGVVFLVALGAYTFWNGGDQPGAASIRSMVVFGSPRTPLVFPLVSGRRVWPTAPGIFNAQRSFHL